MLNLPMDELVDILDAQGRRTGKTAMKSEAHRNGWFHPTVHIWCYTKNGKILLQQRGSLKATHPLLWDVSVAGHIGAGEEMEEAALREVQEEIGLVVAKNELEKVGVFKAIHRHGDHLIDCEFHHVFLCELKLPLEKLSKQESEVAQLALIPLTQFSEETWGMAQPTKYVPHGTDYFKTIIQEIQKRL